MNVEFNVYGIRIKGTDEIRYVGYTGVGLKRRLGYHFRNRKKGNKEKGDWLINNRNEIEIIVLAGPFETDSDAHNLERYWIKFYKENGHRLFNKTSGGQGMVGFKHSPESISKTVNHPNSKKNYEMHRKRMIENNPMNNPESVKKITASPNHIKNNPEAIKKKMVHPNSIKQYEIQRIKFLNNEHPFNNPEVREKTIRSVRIASSKKIIQYDLDWNPIRTFNSSYEAGRFFGVKKGGSISRALTGKYHTAYGYKWSYYDSKNTIVEK